MTIQNFIGNFEAFPILARWDFFNHGGVAPLPAVAARAIEVFAKQASESTYIDTGWYQDVELLRSSAAKLIGAHRDEIAFVKNTSEGIATVANGIDWQRGDRIVTTNIEYPANIYPWMDVANRHGVELVLVEEQANADGSRSVPMDRFMAEVNHPKTRLVALSHVEYASGQRWDIATIGKACRERGKLFCVDAIQTMGIIPIDVVAMNIDYLAADGHKWLLGPEGAGIFYCRKELLAKTRPVLIGWMNVINAQNYGDYDFTLRNDAAKFECGSWNIPGLLGLKASLELLADLTTPLVSERIKTLTDYLIGKLSAAGFEIVSPRAGESWSGIVSFNLAHRKCHEAVVRHLRKEDRIEIALREKRLRATPHFYNTEKQMDRLVECLVDAQAKYVVG